MAKRNLDFKPTPDCPNCGGIHFGSGKCPYTSAPCSVCGDPTIYACSDCRINTGKSIHVCGKSVCQDAHEATAKCKPVAAEPSQPEGMERSK